MLLLGPPGTGKTTCARKLAVMMKQLEVLPSDRFEYVTASNLIDRYVGGTFNNTVEALRRALGGILFIDEAYGITFIITTVIIVIIIIIIIIIII